jgi:hypothetical protein
MVKLAPLLLAIAVSTFAQQGIDLVFVTQRNFTSACLKALGDAGIALPGDISMGQNNPALLFSSCKSQGKGIVSLGYGRDSLFNRHLLPISYAHPKNDGAFGGFYRFQSGDGGLSQHEFTINFSGQLSDKVDVQGAVDYGVNIRYETMKDERHEKQQLPIERRIIDRNGTSAFLSTIDSVACQYDGAAGARRCIVDIGFYQPDIMENVDFGLVIRNVIGYQWKKEHPFVAWADSALRDTVITGDTLSVVQRTYTFRDVTRKKKAWLPGKYRTLTLGALYRPSNAPMQLFFPIDLEILGLFDTKIKNGFIFRGGVGAQLNEAFTLRIGYARQPKTILEGVTTFKNANIFTGGAGLAVAKMRFDCYFSQGAFGVTAVYGL